ncbi:MAG: DUF6789 family protein [Candidatus Bathyarchaeia archaeon]
MKNTTVYSASRGIAFGLIGGVIGAIVMGGIAYMMPIPNTGGAPFFVAAAMMMGMKAMAFAAGWGLHLVAGLVVGGIFGTITSQVSKLRCSNVARGLILGIVAGVVVWVVFFMPMMASLMPALMSMGSMVAGSFAAHLIYGLILGGVVGGLLPRTAAHKCEACGVSFKSQEDLMKHGEEHVKTR